MNILHFMLFLMVSLSLKAAENEVQSPISHLLALPKEMQKEIIKKITDPAEIVALKRTNKALSHLINSMIDRQELDLINPSFHL